jgi:hypothetical protein
VDEGLKLLILKEEAYYEMLHRTSGLDEFFGTTLSGSGYGQMTSSCKHGNETTDSIKCEQFLVDEWLLAFQEGLCSMELGGWYSTCV